jgi:hypothetical protein
MGVGDVADGLALDEEVALGFHAHLLVELGALAAVVEGFDGLLEGDGDEEADADGGDVDEEVSPGVGGGVGRVDVEHGAVAPKRICGYHPTSRSFDFAQDEMWGTCIRQV